MTVYVWTDRRNPAVPRALIQRGDCTRNHCGQFSISISDGQVGLTVRFESEAEFRRFLEQGEVAVSEVSCVSETSLTQVLDVALASASQRPNK
jgi:hypothetical protein